MWFILICVGRFCLVYLASTIVMVCGSIFAPNRKHILVLRVRLSAIVHFRPFVTWECRLGVVIKTILRWPWRKDWRPRCCAGHCLKASSALANGLSMSLCYRFFKLRSEYWVMVWGRPVGWLAKMVGRPLRLGSGLAF